MAEGLLDAPDGLTLKIGFDNYSDADCTVITMEGQDRSNLLIGLTSALASAGVEVRSASVKSGNIYFHSDRNE